MGIQNLKNSGDPLRLLRRVTLPSQSIVGMNHPFIKKDLKGLFSLGLFLCLFFISGFGCMDSKNSDLLIGSRSVKDLIPDPVVVVTPEMPVISGKEMNRLRKKLLDQFISEKKKQRKDQSELYLEFTKNQKIFYKEWSAREKEVRKKYFLDHDSGSDRRHFIKDFIKRREELVQDQKKALQNLKRHQEDEIRDLEIKNLTLKKEAEAYFREKRRPPFLE